MTSNFSPFWWIGVEFGLYIQTKKTLTMRLIEASFIVLTTKNVFFYVTPYSLVLVCSYFRCSALTLDAGLLARCQYPEGPATGHLDTSFSWFPCVYKRMLRWFPSFQVATTCLSCSPPDLNFLVTLFSYLCTCNNYCHRVITQLQLNKYYYYYY